MSQSSRRRWFRTGFLLVCVAPLVALLVYGWSIRRAGYARAQETALRQTLGMRVQIGQLIHPRPGVVRYLDLKLADAETGRAIARCRVAEVHQPNGAGKPVELSVQGAAIEAGATTSLFNLIEQLLRNEFRSEDLYVTLSTDAIEFDKALPFPQLKGISGTIRSTEQAAEARIVFFPVESEAHAESAATKVAATKTSIPTGVETAAEENKTLLRVVRGRPRGQQGEPLKPVDQFEFHTGGISIPCEALTPLAGCELTALAGSRFHGKVWAWQEAVGWVSVVRGELLGVDLNRLIGRRFGHSIEGKVNVTIEQVGAVAGRLTEAALTVAGGPGRISRSLLAAGSDALRLTPSYSPKPPELMYPYKELAAKVEINRRGGVFIDGRCAPSREVRGAVLLAGDGKPLWMPPVEQPLSASGLVRSLMTGDDPTTSANSQIAWLLARLPIEAIVRRPPPAAPAVISQTGPRSEPPPSSTLQAPPPSPRKTASEPRPYPY